MSINKMKVFFHCPNCGHEETLLDYHENTSSERYEYFVVLNMDERSQCGEIIKDGKYWCPDCNKSVALDMIFQNKYCSVENIDDYIGILVSGLLDYIDRGYFVFSEWNYDETPFPALDRLCNIYPSNLRLRELRMVYKDICSFGKRAIKKYTKVELRNETVTKGCVLAPALLKKLYLHDGVRIIGKAAFRDCSSLPDVYLPSGVTSIDDDAFRGCRNLRTIHMSDNVTNIGNRAFYGCHSLSSLYIPAKLTCIGEEAFLGCVSLKKLWIPQNTVIGKHAFAGCINLSLIEVHESVDDHQLLEAGILPETQIVRYSEDNYQPFENSGDSIPAIDIIERVIYPEGTTAIDETTFTLGFCKKVKHVTIPSSVRRIGPSAFDGCEALQEADLPDGVMLIGNSAFMNCKNLTHMRVPDDVTKIAPYSFAMCSRLKTAVLPHKATEIGEYAFEYCSSLEEIELPNALEIIGKNAFQSCKSLKSLSIPANVKRIEREAFSNCTALETIIIENGTERMDRSILRYMLMAEKLVKSNLKI